MTSRASSSRTEPVQDHRQVVPALDIPSKTNGQAKYGIDVFLPNMAYGALVVPRSRYSSKVLSIDDSEAKKIPGFIKAVKIDDSMGKCTGWVVAVADKFPTAMKAAKALKVKWDAGPYANLSSADLLEQYKQLAKDEKAGAAWVLEGDVDKGFGEAEKVLEVEYTTDMVCHATMEPLNCTVQHDQRRMACPCRHAKHVIRAHDADGLSFQGPEEKAGGTEDFRAPVPGGRRLGGKQDYDDILAAAYCVKEIGRPVKLIHTRETNFATSFARTPTYHKVKAGIKDGELLAMNQDIVCGWMGARFGVGKKYGTDWLQQDSWDEKKQDIDQWSIGGSDHWYYMKNHRVRAWNHEATTWAVQASALRTFPTRTTSSSSSRPWMRSHWPPGAIHSSSGCRC